MPPTLDFRDATFLLAAVGHLALAILCVSRGGIRGRRGPLAFPLALLAFDLFGWTFAVFCNHLAPSAAWRALDAVFSALAPPVVLHVVLAFVGRLRVRRLLVRALYAGYALFALSSIATTSIESRAWAAVFLAGWLPTFVYEVWLLVQHLRASGDADEKARTRLMLGALLVGGAFASTDLWHDAGVPLPPLAPIGTLLATALVAVVALRFRLFERNLGATTSLYAVSVAACAVLLYLTLFQGLRGNLPAMTFGITVVTLLLTAFVREATSSFSNYRERVERLAVMGRFSAQMAHDLKNPLAALVGAVQLLELDAGASGPRASGRDFHALILEQAERIRAIVEKYERLGRVEPVRSRVQVNDLVKRVTALQPHASRELKLDLELDLDPALPDCELDPDLLAGALENLVRNAVEAMDRSGSVVVRTRVDAHDGAPASLILAVADTGEGMDARQVERAFDDFYTTKATGSGLGLPFVRRVALAHGGDASLTSRRGAGTTVEIRLPLAC
ncbi:ATP-binding protein [Pendulispora brunnea]|uniref:histidine kinase n=1 Tax=Pendulispora brunnea TaxID=2905690 RepID=A0ABZ2KD06_9BACT